MPTKRKAAPKKAHAPVLLPDGSAILLLGLVADAECSCVHLTPATVELLRLKPGDYIQIDDEERCTQIVRQIANCGPCCVAGMRPNYLYMDRRSAYYLDSELHACLRVRPALYPLDCP